MRSQFTSRAHIGLIRMPAIRHLARRRTQAVCALIGLALLAGVVGAVLTPQTGAPLTGPFSYFPTH